MNHSRTDSFSENRKSPEKKESEQPQVVVGIGASAGGLEALQDFFANMPADSGAAFVVIQHLAPDYKSLMVELLTRHTQMPVERAEDGHGIQANHIYLIPPKFNLTIKDGKLILTPHDHGKKLNLPVDVFFHSLADECKDAAVGVVLSGTGSDGTRGIRSIKEAGGLVIVQEEASAKFSGMPANAISTGLADIVTPPDRMAAEILRFVQNPIPHAHSGTTFPAVDQATLDQVIKQVSRRSGLDFSRYKTSTISRRLQRRMSISQISDFQDYLDFLATSKQEVDLLVKDLLISVTKFFRDTAAFEELEEQLPEIFQSAEGEAVRIWSAGCATGEEAYSLVMLAERYRRRHYPDYDLKVFATDVDKTALAFAGQGIYPASIAADVPPDLLETFFEPVEEDHYRVKRALRDRVVFAEQNIIRDAPFTRIDLIACRNLLIYLQNAAQQRVLSIFHFSLRKNGVLFLGSSETIGNLDEVFEIVNSRFRLYRKSGSVPGPRLSQALEDLSSGGNLVSRKYRHASSSRAASGHSIETALHSRVIDFLDVACLVVNERNELVYSIGPVSQYLTIPAGPSTHDLTKLTRRDMSLALSTSITRAFKTSEPVDYSRVKLEMSDGSQQFVDIHAELLEADAEPSRLVMVVLDASDKVVTAESEEFDPKDSSMQRIQTLERELEQTRASLQAAIEEQETSNEELQASNEELLAANEELQSTNEELESVNEELYTVNAEHQSKIGELTELNNDLDNLLRGAYIATLFINEHLEMRRFTPDFAVLTDLRPHDIGRSLKDFSHPILAEVAKLITEVNEKNEPCMAFRQTADGRDYLLKAHPYLGVHAQQEGYVVSLIDLEKLREISQQSQEEEA